MYFGGGIYRDIRGNTSSIFTLGREMTDDEHKELETNLLKEVTTGQYDASLYFQLQPWEIELLESMFPTKDKQVEFLRNLLSINFL